MGLITFQTSCSYGHSTAGTACVIIILITFLKCMHYFFKNKKGELFWRQGKLHEVQVTVEEGQISITRKNSLAEEIINKKVHFYVISAY